MTTPAGVPTKPYKAIAGFLVTVLAGIIVAVQGRPEVDTLKPVAWLLITGGAIVNAAVVYGITNPPTSAPGPL